MKYKVAILGGGPGGYVAAIKAAQLGGKVLLVERENLGGVCLNKGCIPTKTLLKSSGMYKSILNAEQFGIKVENITVDFKSMMRRKQEVVNTLVNGIKGLMNVNGVKVISSEGRIIDASHVEVGNDIYEAENIIIATGSRPYIPNIKGADSTRVLDSDGLLSMDHIPSSITIIGGGVIGIEFAVLLSELGCKVTIVEMMEDILFMADSDVRKELVNNLTRNNIRVITCAKVCEISEDRIIYEKEGQKCSLQSENVLISVGRIPNADIDELDRLGIKYDRGRILTDDRMETSVKNIYAIGDANGKYMLAHVASEEGIVAVENIFGHSTSMRYNSIPQCIYSHPEIAWVGLTEKEAVDKGYDVSVGKFPVSANGKSIAEGDASGFIKIVIDKRYNEILGLHMICSHATDMIAQGVLAINTEMTAEDIATAIFPHPTVSEALMEAAQKALGKAIHIV